MPKPNLPPSVIAAIEAAGETIPKSSKYRNVAAYREYRGETIRFDSKVEADRWDVLVIANQAGLISNLARQVSFTFQRGSLVVEGVTYRCDFMYRDSVTKKDVIEDVKGGPVTDAYRIKRALMKAFHDIDIVEIRKDRHDSRNRSRALR